MKDEAYGLLMLNSKDETFKTLTDTWHGSDGKKSACNAKDLGSIPGSGRSPGERKGNPLQHSCLENSMDRGACWASVHGVTKSQTWLSNEYFSKNKLTEVYGFLVTGIRHVGLFKWCYW